MTHSGARFYRFYALPTVEYAGVPHSDTYLFALPTVVYAGLPHIGTCLYARPQWAETDQRDAMGPPEY